jgi:hypothetical protein
VTRQARLAAALLAGAFGAGALNSARMARAEIESDATLFQSGVDSLQHGRPGEAVVDFESLADHGVVEATLSFDRGLAYADRVRVGGEQPGDLGEAAHGFLEAARLASDSGLAHDAEKALAIVRAEVGRRRARAGEPVELDPGMSLGPSIVRLLAEDTWALLGVVGSFVVGGALFARRAVRERRSRIAAGVAGGIGALLFLGCTGATLAARHDRLTLVIGVIVSAGAHPTDERGLVVPNATTLPEAAEVRVLARRAGWAQVRWGTTEAWIPAQSVRPISELAR